MGVFDGTVVLVARASGCLGPERAPVPCFKPTI